MPIFFVEQTLQNITFWVGVPMYGGSCVYGVCVGVCVAGLVRPCIMPWLGQYFFLMLALFRILLQALSCMPGKLSLLRSLLKSEKQASWHVSFPKGMVSCEPGQGRGLLP